MRPSTWLSASPTASLIWAAERWVCTFSVVEKSAWCNNLARPLRRCRNPATCGARPSHRRPLPARPLQFQVNGNDQIASAAPFYLKNVVDARNNVILVDAYQFLTGHAYDSDQLRTTIRHAPW